MDASPSQWQAETGQDVIFTLDPGYRAPMLRQGLSMLVVTAIGAFAATYLWPAWLFTALAGLRAASNLARYFLASRFRTRLTREGIEARGNRNHFVPWTAITGIEASGYSLPVSRKLSAPYVTASGGVAAGYDSVRAGTGQLRRANRRSNSALGGYRAKLDTVKISRSTGRPITLRAPVVAAWQSDPKFDDKVRLIRKWWLAYAPQQEQQPAPDAG